MTELYYYKVVYPSGTYIRTTPSIHAENTGEILEYGQLFEASKSLFLDGINYVKLADGRGWVFGNKGDVEVLKLKEVVRTPVKATPLSKDNRNIDSYDKTPFDLADEDNHSPPLSSSGVKLAYHAHISPHAKLTSFGRNELIFWRGVRSRCGNCRSFDDIEKLCHVAATVLNSRPPQAPLAGQGPARSAWMASSALCDSPVEPNHTVSAEQQVRNCIAQIAAITQQSRAGHLAETSGLEIHLWLLAKLGASGVSHVMDLVVEAANEHFERLSDVSRADLIEAALELATTTKAACAEYSQRTGILADDIKNFLQRWILLKYKKDLTCINSHGSSGSLCSVDSLSSATDDNSPLGRNKPRSSSGSSTMSSGSSSSRHPSKSPILDQANAWINTLFCNRNVAEQTIYEGDSMDMAIESPRKDSDRSDETDYAVLIRNHNCQNSNEKAQLNGGIALNVGRFIRDWKVQIERFTNDPDFQFAGII